LCEEFSVWETLGPHIKIAFDSFISYVTFRFPPGENFNAWPVRSEDDLKVYVDEESPLRFLPPLPKFGDTERGWFMVQDFLFALPLSAFVLTVHVNKKIDKAVLQSYLSDPIKRHICIGCLPNEVRNPILKVLLVKTLVFVQSLVFFTSFGKWDFKNHSEFLFHFTCHCFLKS
ncbi:hypothetical protein TELCIR_09885, partial [Teladorsagia circumcincta]